MCCAEMHELFRVDSMFWEHRPLSAKMLAYAAEDVQGLLALASKLRAELGHTGAPAVARLSEMNMQWCFDAADRGGAGSTDACARPPPRLAFQSYTYVEANCERAVDPAAASDMRWQLVVPVQLDKLCLPA